MNKTIILLLLLILITILVFGLLPFFQEKPLFNAKTDWSKEKQREYANKLKVEGLVDESINEYIKYLDMSDESPQTEANIYYTIGKMSEDSGEYEKALAYFYKVELTYPDVSFKSELGEHIISCLEKLGRGLDAQNTLDSRALLSSEEEPKGKILAKIGKDKVTEWQIEQELQKLPLELQKEYNDPVKRSEFLQQYLVKELLWRKAKRLGLDKDPQLRQRMNDIKKDLVVQELLNQEIKEMAQVTPNQVELYYKANKEKYREPGKIKTAFVSTATEEEIKKPDLEFEDITDWITEGQTNIKEIGESKELINKAFSKEQDEITEPIEINDNFYVLKVLEKKPGRERPFSEVKDLCTYEYQQERTRIVYQELLEQTLQAEDVEIYEQPMSKN